MHPRSSRIMCLCVLALTGALCAGCSWTAAPKFSVLEARLVEQTDEGAVLTFVVEASNTNDEALPIGRVRYQVWVDDTRVFSGSREAQIGVRRRGSQRFELPAPIEASLLPEGIASVRIAGSASYKEREQLAKVLRDIGLRRPSSPVRAKLMLDFGESAALDGSDTGTKPSDPAERASVSP